MLSADSFFFTARFLNSYRRAFLLLMEGKQGCVKHGMQQGDAAACPGRSLWPPQPGAGAQGTAPAPAGALLLTARDRGWLCCPSLPDTIVYGQIRYFSPVVAESTN